MGMYDDDDDKKPSAPFTPAGAGMQQAFQGMQGPSLNDQAMDYLKKKLGPAPAMAQPSAPNPNAPQGHPLNSDDALSLTLAGGKGSDMDELRQTPDEDRPQKFAQIMKRLHQGQ